MAFADIVLHDNGITTFDINLSQGLNNYALSAEVGGFIITGQGVSVNRIIQLSPGDVICTGISIPIPINRRLICSVGTFEITGQAASLQ